MVPAFEVFSGEAVLCGIVSGKVFEIKGGVGDIPYNVVPVLEGVGYRGLVGQGGLIEETLGEEGIIGSPKAADSPIGGLPW